jgi:small-conductance mechanosensitive channel
MWDVFLASVAELLPRLVVALLIIGLTLLIAGRLTRVVQRLLVVSRQPLSIHSLIVTATRLLILAFGGIFALQALGLGQAILGAVASLGVIGLVLSFALQDITKQFAAGVLLLITAPFHVGDRIKIGAHEGIVVEVQLRATVLKTADGDEVLIPNADVYTATITNISRYDARRYRLALTVPPHAAVDATRSALSAAVATIPGIAPDPAPTVVFTGVDTQAVNLEVRYWIARATPDHEALVTQVIAAAREVLGGATELPN